MRLDVRTVHITANLNDSGDAATIQDVRDALEEIQGGYYNGPLPDRLQSLQVTAEGYLEMVLVGDRS